MAKDKREFYVVREESKGKPIIGVYPVARFAEASEVVDHHHKHPIHYTVVIEKGLTKAKRAWMAEDAGWLKTRLANTVSAQAHSQDTDINGAIRDCITTLLHIAKDNGLADNGLGIEKLLNGAWEVYDEEQEEGV